MKLGYCNSLTGQNRPRGSAWSMAMLAPEVWLDATKLNLSDGAAVAQFTDESDHGRHFVPPSPSSSPTYILDGINGLPAVEGDGVDDNVATPNFGAFDNWWGVILFQPVTMVSGRELWAMADYPVQPSLYRLLETDGALSININQSGGPMVNSIALANGVKRAIFIEGSATSLSYRADNGALISKSFVGNYPTTNDDGRMLTTPMRLFARGDPGLYFNVRIGEVGFGGGILSGAQKSAMWAGLSNKWGTSIPI